MLNGYMGKILIIDLKTNETYVESLKEEDLQKYIGGSGLGAKYLYELTGPETDPLSEDNILIFMVGPLTGTRFFSSDRFEVVTKSPLTGIYAESDCGGKWGSMLKRSGFDGVIIKGKSKRPVYIWINNEDVKIISADPVWGMDTFETQLKLKNFTNKDAEVACIGPAGEKLVKFAAIITSDKHARAAARAGVGTVMGSKKLKAIVVSGNKNFNIFNPEKFDELYKEISKTMVANTKAVREYGTSVGVEFFEKIGELPIKNWSKRRFRYAGKISGQQMAKEILKKKYFCGKCLIGCGRAIQIEEGLYKTDGIIGGPEYETVGMLGSNLLIKDIRAIAKFNELCNRYGMDTISTGSTLAMVMECYENKLVNKKWLDNIDLVWGNEKVIMEMIHKIGKREGIGELLGEGTLRVAKKIGSYAIEFALQVKGLEAPAHDPRARNGVGLGYATSNRGACHLQAFTHDFEDGASMPDLGYPETMGRFQTEGKAEFVIKFQNLMSMFDSLHCCKFTLFGGLTLKPLVKSIHCVTGMNMSEEEFLRTGERIFNLKRLYNVRCGISRKDDTLPPRFLTQKRGEGEYEDSLPYLGMMLDEYYKIRGWNELGIPLKEKIIELGLEEYIV